MDKVMNNYSYVVYLTDSMLEEAKMDRFIKECILISESKNTIAAMQILNEDADNKFTLVIKKIIAAIGKMWGKFVNAVNTLVTSDKNYLEKYKDIITKKTPLEKNYEMYNYELGIRNITNSPVPTFNYGSMKEELISDEKFIAATNLKTYTNGNKNESYVDQFKAYFRGSAVVQNIKSTQFNMTDAYNYCYNYTTMVANLKKDRDQIQSAAEYAIKILDAAVAGGEEGISSESSNMYRKKQLYYSNVYEGFILEKTGDPVKPDATGNTPATGKPITKPVITATAQSNNPQNSSAASNMNNIDDSKGTDKDDNAIKTAIGGGSNNTQSDNTERIKRYINLCGGVLGAKQTVSEEIYKAYMDIIRSHVKDFAGTKNPKDDKTAQSGTSYGNGKKAAPAGTVEDMLDGKDTTDNSTATK